MIRKPALPRDIIIVVAAAFGMIGYIYLTPPVSQLNLIQELSLKIEPGQETYVQRFAASLILLGVLPALAARIVGYTFKDLGFRKPQCATVWLVAALAGGVVIGLIGVFSASLSSYYPYDSGLVERVSARGAGPFLVHSAAYLLCYYLPWELLFRGVLVFPLLDVAFEKAAVNGKTMVLASLQTIPSSLLHFGHPFEETAGAVVFGIAAAWIVLRTRSIIPVVLLHAAAGVSLDLFIVLGLG